MLAKISGIRFIALAAVVVVAALVMPTAVSAEPSPEFEKRVLIDNYFCDGITAGDINRDGTLDVVAGPYWYPGPDFTTKYEFYPAAPLDPAASPSNSMFSYVYEFNADLWLDILVLGRVLHHEAFWYENPQGAHGHWTKHFVVDRVYGESPPFADVDGDGRPELVTHWGKRWGFLQPDRNDPSVPWIFRPIAAAGEWQEYYHGTGIGDVDGDGRLDLILNDGWWRQPASNRSPSGTGEFEPIEWASHPMRFAERGGAQMFASDVDGDGDNDVITSLDAHGWGLAWFEQVHEAGDIKFRRHLIMGDRSQQAHYGVAFSQPHALALADIDGDGLQDIVAGKRRWAHGPTGDVEPDTAPVVYWFQLVRHRTKPAEFLPHLVDDNSGVGVQITAVDINGDNRTDILSASKLGTFVFINRLIK